MIQVNKKKPVQLEKGEYYIGIFNIGIAKEEWGEKNPHWFVELVDPLVRIDGTPVETNLRLLRSSYKEHYGEWIKNFPETYYAAQKTTYKTCADAKTKDPKFVRLMFRLEHIGTNHPKWYASQAVEGDIMWSKWAIGIVERDLIYERDWGFCGFEESPISFRNQKRYKKQQKRSLERRKKVDKLLEITDQQNLERKGLVFNENLAKSMTSYMKGN